MNKPGGLVFIALLLAMTACTPVPGPSLLPSESRTPTAASDQSKTILPTQPPLASPSLTSSPTPTPAPSLTPTASPTPLYELDLSTYDPDIFPPIDISHMPPLIARSDDTVSIVFNPLNIFCMKFLVSCMPDGVLYYSYGDETAFQSITLSEESVDEMDSLVARLPASDTQGRPLRYYAEFAVPAAGYTQRYPAAGTIDLFSTDNFITIELPVENAVAPGEKVYDFFWGYGPDKVRQATYHGYPWRVGPPALDVADDGRIAIIDPVNERIIIFDPAGDSYTSYPLPFIYASPAADLGFDREGRLMVCDYQGEEVAGTYGPKPYCYLLLPDGKLLASTPVYVKVPAGMTKDLKILDYADSRLVVPFDSQGKASSRVAQREKQRWDLPKRYVEGQYPLAHYADVKQGVAFEIHSASPLGALIDFERTPQGYIMTFSIGDRMRAVWIDSSGSVLKDITLPFDNYSELNFNGQTAVTPDGSLYVMSSTRRGIEVHYVTAP